MNPFMRQQPINSLIIQQKLKLKVWMMKTGLIWTIRLLKNKDLLKFRNRNNKMKEFKERKKSKKKEEERRNKKEYKGKGKMKQEDKNNKGKLEESNKNTS